MIKKKFRIPRQSFSAAIKNRSIHTPHTNIIIISNKLPNNRFAVVVSAKQCPTAVLRHRVKRKLYELCEQYTVPLQGEGGGKDTIIYVKRPIGAAQIPIIIKEVAPILAK